MRQAGHMVCMGGSRDAYTSHVKGKHLSWTAPGIVPKTHCHPQSSMWHAWMHPPHFKVGQL